ncbi:ankyrin repeat domain-containing protein [Wolbachia endosymbiont (group A) of Agelastica alni]|uniref:ankyrin repeat domain-containing protein n=1 Tax=Wolbachia endosymbiont (group A) of Agelastica alni TaxID=3066130 RepID=UPI00333F15C1
MAAKHGDIEIVNALIKAGANVNAENKDKWTPLHFAAAWGHKDVLEVLLTAGANVNAENKNKWTPLYLAAVRGHKDVLEVLLTAGANVNAQDENGKTPLYYACSTRYYNKDIVKVLLQNGAKVDATIPLHMAAEHGDIEIVNALIGKNANVNEVDENGRTPLHLATELSRKYVVEVLLTAGADINAQDKNGKTPLHCATNRSWLCSLVGGIAELLIEKGANLDLQDNDGKTPLRFAIEKQDKNVAEALIRGTLIQNSSIQKPDYLTDEFSTYWDKHKKVVTGQLADRERSTASSSANQSISNSNHTSVQSNIMPILKKGNTKNNNVPPSDLSKNVNTPHSTQESKLPIITASIGLLLGLSIAYLTGAAALTPAIAAVAVFIAAAVAGALLGYGIGKVSGQFSDASISEHDSKQAAAGLI